MSKLFRNPRERILRLSSLSPKPTAEGMDYWGGIDGQNNPAMVPPHCRTMFTELARGDTTTPGGIYLAGTFVFFDWQFCYIVRGFRDRI
jgi:hypothetical protein